MGLCESLLPLRPVPLRQDRSHKCPGHEPENEMVCQQTYRYDALLYLEVKNNKSLIQAFDGAAP